MTQILNKTRKEQIWQEIERKDDVSSFGAELGIRATAMALRFLGFALRPFGQLRIALPYDRTMGRFYGNTEYYLRSKAFDPPSKREILLFVAREHPVNTQIMTMLKRRVTVYQSDRLRRLLEVIRKDMPDDPIWVDLGATGWLRGAEWYDPGPQLAFTEKEHERGKAILKELGVEKNQAHVCIFAKDRYYSDDPENPPDQLGYWANNDFRNCDIDTFIPAAEYLVEQGIKVFRMGVYPPEKPLPDGLHPDIVDYTAQIRPTLEDPDFVDTYLQATCKIFIGCTSGIYILSAMFGRPIAATNMVPYGECGRNLEDVFLLKTCRNRNTGALIPFRELIDMGLDADWLTQAELEELDRKGIEFVDNGPEEILEQVREINMRIDGTWSPKPGDDELDSKYREISPAICFDGLPFPGRLSAAFLRAHRDLLE